MRLIKTQFGYNFWVGVNNKGKPYYNITPQDQQPPKGGYMSSEYICKIKDVPNIFDQY